MIVQDMREVKSEDEDMITMDAEVTDKENIEQADEGELLMIQRILSPG